ncbi:MAG: hypothetical protein NTX28_15910 [Novosphingobium sp.]|nr:hypothetical protein [Novosphingobium sp.]
MQFTREVNWGVEDFAFAGLLLGSAGAMLELVHRKARQPQIVAIASAATAALVLVIWADAAVGIF